MIRDQSDTSRFSTASESGKDWVQPQGIGTPMPPLTDPPPSSVASRNQLLLRSRLTKSHSGKMKDASLNPPLAATAINENISRANSTATSHPDASNLAYKSGPCPPTSERPDAASSARAKNSRHRAMWAPVGIKISHQKILARRGDFHERSYETYTSSMDPINAVNMILSGERDFIYMAPDEHDRYRLHVIDPAIPIELFRGEVVTLSRNGIIRKEEGIMTHFPLNEYLEEYKLYRDVRKITFFRCFLIGKLFGIWKDIVRRQRFIKRREALKSSLLHCDSHLRRIMLYVQEICLEIESMDAYNGIVRNTPSLSEFVAIQWDAYHSVVQKKSDLMHRMIAYMKDIGEDRLLAQYADMPSNAIKRKLDATKVEANEFDYSSKLLESSDGYVASKVKKETHNDQAMNNKSFESDDNESQKRGDAESLAGFTFADRSYFRIKARKFYNMLRMSDYRLRQSLYVFAKLNLIAVYNTWSKVYISRSREAMTKILSMNDIHDADKYIRLPQGEVLEQIRNDPVGLICLPLRLPNDAADKALPELEKSIADFADIFKEILTSIITAAQYSDHLADSPDLGTVLLPLESTYEHSTLLALASIERDSTISSLYYRCLSVVTSDIDQLFLVLCTFGGMHRKYRWALELGTAITEEMVNAKPVSELSSLLQCIDDDSNIFRKLPQYTDIGVFRLALTPYVHSVLAQYKACHNLLETYIPRVFIKRGNVLIDKVLAITAAINMNASTVDEFASTLESYQDAMIAAERTQDESAYLSALKFVLDDHDLHQSNEVIDTNLMLTAGYHKYLQALSHFRELRPDRTEKFKRHLILRVKEIEKPIEEAKRRLDADLITSPGSNSKSVLFELSIIESLVSRILKISDTIIRCKRAMEVEVFDENIIRDLVETLHNYKVLWGAISEVEEESMEFRQRPFRTANCDAYLTLINSIRKRRSRLHNADNSVSSWLESMVDEHRILLPLIKCLQSPTLCNHHKMMIQEIIGIKLYRPDELIDALVHPASILIAEDPSNASIDACDQFEECLVSDLIEAKVGQYAEAIKEIYDTSVAHWNVLESLKSIPLKCDSLKFEFYRDTNRNNMLFFRNLDYISAELEDYIVTVMACSRSQSNKLHVDIIESLLLELNAWLGYLEHFSSIQRSFHDIQTLIRSPRGMKTFEPISRYYNSIEEQWKSLTNSMYHDCGVSSVLRRSQIVGAIEHFYSSIFKANEIINEILVEMHSSYPKLYLMTRENILLLYSLPTPHEVFRYCHHLVPAITGFTYEGFDDGSTVSAMSGPEEISFVIPVSSRTSIIDWLVGVDGALSARLQGDIIEIMQDPYLNLMKYNNDLVEVNKQVWSNQSIILCMQTVFWMDLLSTLRTNAPALARQSREIAQLAATTSKLDNFNAFSDDWKKRMRATVKSLVENNEMQKRHVICNANVILLFTHQREILDRTLKDFEAFFATESRQSAIDSMKEGNFHPFWFNSLVQYSYSFASKEVLLKHGTWHAPIPHGLKYLGLCERMVITPLTDRCLLSVYAAIGRDSTMPLLHGNAGIGKRSIMRHVAYDMGVEFFDIDCSKFVPTKSIETIKRAIQCAVEANCWMVFSSIQDLNPQAFSVLFTSLSVLQNASVSGASSMNFHGFNVPIPSDKTRSLPLIGVLMNATSKFVPEDLTPSLRKQFRVLYVVRPDCLKIFELLLLSYQYPTPSMLALRFEGFCKHFARSCHVDLDAVVSAMIRSIRTIGIEVVVKQISDLSVRLNMTIKRFLVNFPSYQHSGFTMNDLKFACKVYLCFDLELKDKHKNKAYSATDAFNYVSQLISFMLKSAIRDIDSNKRISTGGQPLHRSSSFTPRKQGSMVSLSMPLVSASASMSIIVVGDSGCGKSVAIQQALRESGAVTLPVPNCVDVNMTNSSPAQKIDAHRVASPAPVLKLYPRFMTSKFASAGLTSDCDIIHSMITRWKEREMLKLCPQDMQLGKLGVIAVDCEDSMCLADAIEQWEIGALAATTQSVASSVVKDSLLRIRIIWEVCELKWMPPSVLCSTPVIYAPRKMYEPQNILNNAKTQLFQSYDESIQATLNDCWEQYFRPCLKIASTLTDTCVTPESIAFRALDIVKAIFTNSYGPLVPSALLSGACISLRQIVLFALTWTFGSCSADASLFFEEWFGGVWKRPPLIDSQTRRFELIFPPTPHCFDYLLNPEEFEIGRFYWVQWTESETLFYATQGKSVSRNQKSSKIPAIPFHCGPRFYTIGIERGCLVAPSAQSCAMSFILHHALSHKQVPSPPPMRIVLMGMEGSGKSCMLRLLANQLGEKSSCYGVFHSETFSTDTRQRMCKKQQTSSGYQILSALKSAKLNGTTNFIESSTSSLCAAVFIDDLNIEENLNVSDRSSNDMALASSAYELFRILHDQSAIFDDAESKWIPLENVSTVITCRHPSNLLLNNNETKHLWTRYQRVFRDAHVVNVQFDEGIGGCFASKLTAVLPLIGDVFSKDLAQLTSRLVPSLQLILQSSNSDKSQLPLGVTDMLLNRNWTYTCSMIIDRVAFALKEGVAIGMDKGVLQQMAQGANSDVTASGQVNVIRVWESVFRDVCGVHDDSILSRAISLALAEGMFLTTGFTDTIQMIRRKVVAAQMLEAENLLENSVAKTINPSKTSYRHSVPSTVGGVTTESKVISQIKFSMGLLDVTFMTAEELKIHIISNEGTVDLFPRMIDISKYLFWVDLKGILTGLPRLPSFKKKKFNQQIHVHFQQPIFIIEVPTTRLAMETMCRLALTMVDNCHYCAVSFEECLGDRFASLSERLIANYLLEKSGKAGNCDSSSDSTRSPLYLWHIHCTTTENFTSSIWDAFLQAIELKNVSISRDFFLDSATKQDLPNISEIVPNLIEKDAENQYKFDEFAELDSFLSRQRWIICVEDVTVQPVTTGTLQQHKSNGTRKRSVAARTSMLAYPSQSSNNKSSAPVMLTAANILVKSISQCSLASRCKVLSMHLSNYFHQYRLLRDVVDNQFEEFVLAEILNVLSMSNKQQDRDAVMIPELLVQQQYGLSAYTTGTLEVIRKLLLLCESKSDEWSKYTDGDSRVKFESSRRFHSINSTIREVDEESEQLQGEDSNMVIDNEDIDVLLSKKRRLEILLNVVRTRYLTNFYIDDVKTIELAIIYRFNESFGCSFEPEDLVDSTTFGVGLCAVKKCSANFSKLFEAVAKLPSQSELKSMLISIATCLAIDNKVVLMDSSFILGLMISKYFDISATIVYQSIEFNDQAVCVLTVPMQDPQAPSSDAGHRTGPSHTDHSTSGVSSSSPLNRKSSVTKESLSTTLVVKTAQNSNRVKKYSESAEAIINVLHGSSVWSDTYGGKGNRQDRVKVTDAVAVQKMFSSETSILVCSPATLLLEEMLLFHMISIVFFPADVRLQSHIIQAQQKHEPEPAKFDLFLEEYFSKPVVSKGLGGLSLWSNSSFGLSKYASPARSRRSINEGDPSKINSNLAASDPNAYWISCAQSLQESTKQLVAIFNSLHSMENPVYQDLIVSLQATLLNLQVLVNSDILIPSTSGAPVHEGNSNIFGGDSQDKHPHHRGLSGVFSTSLPGSYFHLLRRCMARCTSIMASRLHRKDLISLQMCLLAKLSERPSEKCAAVSHSKIQQFMRSFCAQQSFVLLNVKQMIFVTESVEARVAARASLISSTRRNSVLARKRLLLRRSMLQRRESRTHVKRSALQLVETFRKSIYGKLEQISEETGGQNSDPPSKSGSQSEFKRVEDLKSMISRARADSTSLSSNSAPSPTPSSPGPSRLTNRAISTAKEVESDTLVQNRYPRSRFDSLDSIDGDYEIDGKVGEKAADHWISPPPNEVHVSYNLSPRFSSKFRGEMMFKDVGAAALTGYESMRSELDLLSIFMDASNCFYSPKDEIVKCSHGLWNGLYALHNIDFGIAIFKDEDMNSISARQSIVDKLQDLLYLHYSRAVHSSSLLSRPRLSIDWSLLSEILTPLGIFIVALFVDPVSTNEVLETVLSKYGLHCDSSLSPSAQESFVVDRMTQLDDKKDSSNSIASMDNRKVRPFLSLMDFKKPISIVRSGNTVDLSKVLINESSTANCYGRSVNVFEGNSVNITASELALKRFDYVANKDIANRSLFKPTVHIVTFSSIRSSDLSWLIKQLLMSRRSCILELTDCPNILHPYAELGGNETLHGKSSGFFEGSDAVAVMQNRAANSWILNLGGESWGGARNRIAEFDSAIQFINFEVHSKLRVTTLLSHCLHLVITDAKIYELLHPSVGWHVDLELDYDVRKCHRFAWLMTIAHAVISFRLRELNLDDRTVSRICGDDVLLFGIRSVLSDICFFGRFPIPPANSDRIIHMILFGMYQIDSMPSGLSALVEGVVRYLFGNLDTINEKRCISLFENLVVVPNIFKNDTISDFLIAFDRMLAIGEGQSKSGPSEPHSNSKNASGMSADVVLQSDSRFRQPRHGAIGQENTAATTALLGVSIPFVMYQNRIDSKLRFVQLYSRIYETFSPRVQPAAKAMEFIVMKSRLDRVLHQLPKPINLNQHASATNQKPGLGSYGHNVIPMLGGKNFNLTMRRSMHSDGSQSAASNGGAGSVSSRLVSGIEAYMRMECHAFNALISEISGEIHDLIAYAATMIMWQKSGFDTSNYTASRISMDLQCRIESLYFGIVPKSWHLSSASILVDDWTSTLHQRQHMLNDWLSSGKPGWLYLHLLDDPAGLLLAMKEDFLRSCTDGVAITDLRVEAKVRDPEVPELEEPDAASGKAAAAPTSLTVFATGLHLVNAAWRGGDEIEPIDKTDILEDFTHKSRQDISLRLYVVKKSSHIGALRSHGGLRTVAPPGETQLSLEIPVHIWPCTPISPLRAKSEAACRLRLGHDGDRRGGVEEGRSLIPRSIASFRVTVVMNVPTPPPPAPPSTHSADKNDHAMDRANVLVPSAPTGGYSSEWLIPQSTISKPTPPSTTQSAAPPSAFPPTNSSGAAADAAKAQQQQLNARNIQYRQVAVHSAPLWLLAGVVDK